MLPLTVGYFEVLERWLHQCPFALTVGYQIGIYDSLAPHFCRLLRGAMACVMVMLQVSSFGDRLCRVHGMMRV